MPTLAQEPTPLPQPTPEPVVAPEAPVLPEVEWPLGWGEESAGSFWTNGWDEWFEDEVFWAQVPDAVDQVEDARARYYESILQQQDIISQEEVLLQRQVELEALREVLQRVQSDANIPVGQEELEFLEELLQRMQPDANISIGDNIFTVAQASEITEAYQEAYRYILDERWDQARRAFGEFVEEYSDQLSAGYIDDARFWLCYSMEKLEMPDEEVFEAYHQFIQEFTESRWLDDARANLLEIGRRLAEVNRRNATQYGPIIEELEKEYEFEVALATLDRLRSASSTNDESSNEKTAQAIFSLYDRTEDVNQRVRIISALGRFESPAVADWLTNIASSDADEKVRTAAVDIMGRVGGEASIQGLIDVAMNDPSDAVRQQAAYALQRQGGEAAIRGLIALATKHEDWRTRMNSVSSLSAATVNLRNRTTSDIFVPFSYSTTTGTSTSGNFLISPSATATNGLDAEQREALVKEVVAVLLDLARNDPHVRVRTQAVSALSRINTEEAQEALIDILEGG